MISSILNPSYFEPDFRPIIGLILVMIILTVGVIISNWHNIKNDIDSDWEK